MRRWITEPLLHFLLAGGLLFAAYAWLNRGGADEPRVVHITAAEVTWLKESWTRQWQRPPSEQELRGLVTDYLKEELLAREAKEMGLDEDDTIVRRRLAQKMAFLVQDTARLAEPGEEVLRRFYDARRAQYQAQARISFMQLYFETEAAARRALGELG
ncbi:MAG TPA: peptidyl-prolyl cis-trans isomerase, partial [Rhizobiaceae bacterium]|nr:peptidyl-prolyl cis-trans isomerase [Rhizobiaceae bacterium]